MHSKICVILCIVFVIFILAVMEQCKLSKIEKYIRNTAHKSKPCGCRRPHTPYLSHLSEQPQLLHNAAGNHHVVNVRKVNQGAIPKPTKRPLFHKNKLVKPKNKYNGKSTTINGLWDNENMASFL